jgi:hypothetical protein
VANKSGLLSLLGGYESAVTSAGSTYADAAELTGAINLITSVAASSGVKLPNAYGPGAVVMCRNTDADTVVVYPPTGGTINGGSANGGVNLAQNKTGLFLATGDGSWMFLLGA